MKQFSAFEKAALKRNAVNLSKMIEDKNKILVKLEAMTKEYESIVALIEAMDAPTKAITGGYTTEDIMEKKKVPMNKVDSKGNQIFTTAWEFKYPDTIIPVEKKEEPAAPAPAKEDKVELTEEEIAALDAPEEDEFWK